MSADQRFTLLLIGMGLIFTVLSTAIGLIWRNGKNQGENTQEIKELVKDVADVARSLDKHIQWHMSNRR